MVDWLNYKKKINNKFKTKEGNTYISRATLKLKYNIIKNQAYKICII